MWIKLKRWFLAVLFGRCPICSGVGIIVEERGVQHFVAQQYCPKCKIHFSAM